MPGEMSGLIPTFDVNGGNNCNGGWGNWGGALIGGAIGGAVGAGWNGNRNGCCNTGCCNNGDQYVMDTLTTMRTDINSIGRDNLMQTAAVQSAICQGFGGVPKRHGRRRVDAGNQQPSGLPLQGGRGSLSRPFLQGEITWRSNFLWAAARKTGTKARSPTRTCRKERDKTPWGEECTGCIRP